MLTPGWWSGKKREARQKSGITQEEWENLPDTLSVRLVRVRAKGRDGKMRNIYLATTLIDDEYPMQEIAMLYAERWHIEVKFRDIKTTMQLEEFRVKTPEMARKMMSMVQLTYNLIKVRQMEAIRNKPILINACIQRQRKRFKRVSEWISRLAFAPPVTI